MEIRSLVGCLELCFNLKTFCATSEADTLRSRLPCFAACAFMGGKLLANEGTLPTWLTEKELRSRVIQPTENLNLLCPPPSMFFESPCGSWPERHPEERDLQKLQ